MSSSASRFPDGPIPRQPADLELSETSREELVHVSNTRVAFADYDLLQHDFLELRTEHLVKTLPKLATVPPRRRDDAIRAVIDAWLIENAAFVTRTQTEQGVVNSPIPLDGKIGHGYRPLGYGRAIVVPTMSTWPEADGGSCSGLLDLKGVGVAPDKVPSIEPASDGLFPLECAFRETLFQRVVDAIFAREIPSLWTVPTYAILAFGFDVLGAWRDAPASLLVRRAHRRAPLNRAGDSVLYNVRLAIELLLRSYGITSANHTAWVEIMHIDGRLVKRFGRGVVSRLTPEETGLCLALKGDEDYVKIEKGDIQTAEGMSWPPPAGQMVDFGSLHVRHAFDHPLALGPQISLNVVRPNAANFVRPNAAKALPIKIWKQNRIEVHCRQLARQFARNEVSANELWPRLEAPYRSLLKQWAAIQTGLEQPSCTGSTGSDGAPHSTFANQSLPSPVDYSAK